MNLSKTVIEINPKIETHHNVEMMKKVTSD